MSDRARQGAEGDVVAPGVPGGVYLQDSDGPKEREVIQQESCSFSAEA